jgi:hypothetical protein
MMLEPQKVGTKKGTVLGPFVTNVIPGTKKCFGAKKSQLTKTKAMISFLLSPNRWKQPDLYGWLDNSKFKKGRNHRG